MLLSLFLWLFQPCQAAGNAQPATIGSVVRPFNGTNLDGWEGDTSYWSVKDGVIFGQTTSANPLLQSSYLVWKGGVLRDFELRLEYRIRGGNSGVHVRSSGSAPHAVQGLQADIEDGPNWTGCLFEHGGRGILAMRGQFATWFDNNVMRATEFADSDQLNGVVRPEQWNQYTIRAIGNRVDLELNGYPMCTFLDRDLAKFTPQGLLALQLHEGDPMQVEFRNLELRTLSSAATSDQVGQARWIWTRTEPRDGDQAWFGKKVPLATRATYVRIEGSGDDACDVRINGQLVFESDDWQKPMWVELPDGLPVGLHKFEIRAKNGSGRSGVQLTFDMRLEDGTRRRIVTDSSWSAASTQPPANWLDTPGAENAAGGAVELGRLGAQPWGVLPAAGSYLSAQALDPAEIKLLPDYEAELLYSVPRALQGSWVAMTFDPVGRIYVSDQYGGLYRVTLAQNRVRSVEAVPIDLGKAQGLLWAFDSLYVVVAIGTPERPMGLYRARDTNDDDLLDSIELLSEFQGEAGEHGPHGVVLSPDGQSLYVIAGNHTRLPAPLIASRVPKVWGEDQLLPRADDPNGHAVGILAPGGWLARTNPGGSAWELIACGMRNAYDVAFSPAGEAFTFDSDMEWDKGLPWYRPTRILHLVSGADFGWRHGSGKFPAWVPDSLPSVVDVGGGSPTGVAFGTQSSFPPALREALFACDWARGRILVVPMNPKGASYTGRALEFASGRPLPVTDLAFGPDGAMYFTTGGRMTRSGLYRIRYTGEAIQPTETTEEEPEALEARNLRRRRIGIEQFHGEGHEEVPVESLLQLLDHPDQFVRHAARTSLEHQPIANWGALALEPSETRSAMATIQSAIALCRATDKLDLTAVLDPVLALKPEVLTPELSRDALRAIQLALIRRGLPADELREALLNQLSPRFPSGDLEFDRTLCEILVALGDPDIVARGVQSMEGQATPQGALAFAWPLRVARVGWTNPLRERYFRWIGRARASWAGGASFDLYLQGMVDEALRIVDKEPAELYAAMAARPAPAPSIDLPPAASARSSYERWDLEDLALIVQNAKGTRSFSNGRLAFARARCADCHMLGGAGGSTGPDLTTAVSRFSMPDLLEAIVKPSLVISDQYQDSEILLKDERLLVGRVVRGEDGKIQFHGAPPAEEKLEFEADEVEKVRLSPLSRMPEGLLDPLTDVEVLDLLYFIMSGGVPPE